VEFPLTRISSLTIGSVERKNVMVGVLDLDLGSPAFKHIAGFVSLKFFEELPFTADYARGLLTLETSRSLAERAKTGKATKISLRRRGPSLDVFTRIRLPGGQIAKVEVDSGSGRLILHEKFMPPLGLKPGAKNVTQRSGKDETGHIYQRYFSKLTGDVQLASAPSVAHQRPRVMFQKIIYDGLMGTAFLKRFRVTFDLKGARMIFGPRLP